MSITTATVIHGAWRSHRIGGAGRMASCAARAASWMRIARTVPATPARSGSGPATSCPFRSIPSCRDTSSRRRVPNHRSSSAAACSATRPRVPSASRNACLATTSTASSALAMVARPARCSRVSTASTSCRHDPASASSGPVTGVRPAIACRRTDATHGSAGSPWANWADASRDASSSRRATSAGEASPCSHRARAVASMVPGDTRAPHPALAPVASAVATGSTIPGWRTRSSHGPVTCPASVAPLHSAIPVAVRARARASSARSTMATATSAPAPGTSAVPAGVRSPNTVRSRPAVRPVPREASAPSSAPRSPSTNCPSIGPGSRPMGSRARRSTASRAHATPSSRAVPAPASPAG